MIGHRVSITRAARGVTVGPAQLRLGIWSKLTANHSVDCTASVILGDYSTVAGKGSQIWSHGYVHDAQGLGRYRVDGAVRMGDNVYIGSGAIITGGVQIADQVIVGAGMTVARDLTEPGFYVSGPMRCLPRPADPTTRSDLVRIEDPNLVETVYVKATVDHA